MTRRDPVDAVFVALADPTRRQVLMALSEQPASASQLAERFPISRQAVAKHLAVLSEAGLVTGVREGREVRYRMAAAPLGEAMAWMVGLGSRWDERLERLRRLLEEGRSAPSDD